MTRRIGNKMSGRKRNTNRNRIKSKRKIGGKRLKYKRRGGKKTQKGGNLLQKGKEKIIDTWKNISSKVETFFNFNKDDVGLKMMEEDFSALTN